MQRCRKGDDHDFRLATPRFVHRPDGFDSKRRTHIVASISPNIESDDVVDLRRAQIAYMALADGAATDDKEALCQAAVGVLHSRHLFRIRGISRAIPCAGARAPSSHCNDCFIHQLRPIIARHRTDRMIEPPSRERRRLDLSASTQILSCGNGQVPFRIILDARRFLAD